MFKKLLTLFILSAGMTSSAFAFDVTFSVDLNGSGLANASLNGNFNEWCNGCNAMTDANADGIWEITIPLAAGTYEYKFASGAGETATWESLTAGSLCTVSNFGFTNRTLTVTADVTLPTVCFGSCLACNQAPPTYPVTFQVDMQNVSGFTTPTVNISLDDFCGDCHPMTDANSDGIWETTLNLEAGDYEYKFAYDSWTGQENLTPGSSCTMTTGANTNRTLTVGTAAQVLSTVCWGSCSACVIGTPGCTNAAASNYNASATIENGTCLYATNFNVDMTCAGTTYTNVYITGPWCGWCGAEAYNVLTDANADGIYNVTLNLAAGNVEYKYMVDNWASQENLIDDMQNGGTCAPITDYANYANRQIVIGTTTNDVYGRCTACQVGVPGCIDVAAVNYNSIATYTDGSCLYATQFNVDMNCAGTAFTNVYVTGPWCGWCGAEAYNIMTDANADGIYTVSVNLAAGNVEYKYMVDNWASQENLVDDMQNGASCAPVTDYSSYANRLSPTGQVKNDVYGRCSACPAVLGCTNSAASNYNASATVDNGTCLYATNFNVDMTCAGTTFNNVYITGPWCGWCGAEAYNVLTDANADGIYNVTLNLAAGNVEYKYMVDNWTSQENLVDDMQNGASCAPITDYANYANRQIVVGTTTNDTYGKCSTCSGIVLDPCDLLTLAFDDAGSLTNWSTVADATLPEASLTWDASGALRLSGLNSATDIGRAYIFQYLNNAVNYNGNTTVQLEFDVKSVGALVGTALQLQTEIPGAGVVNTSNLETAGINENTWTHYSYTFNGVTTGSNFRMHFNMAAGAFLGAGGTLLVDNIELNCYTPVVIAGCTDPTALNYNAAATEDDGSCTYPVTYNVTFQVDMNNSGLSNASLNGTFNSWCNGCNAMTDANADGVWEITIPLAAGTYEYKFASGAGQTATWENLSPGSSCTVTNFGYTNRSLVVTGDVTISTVCFGSCLSCNQAPPTYPVTFQVDLQNVTGFTTPTVNISLDNFCGNCHPLTDANSDGIWETTLNLEAGDYEYKFAYDNWTGQEELTPGSPCTLTTDIFTNRTLAVSAASTLPVVCWGSCSECGSTATPVDVTFQVDMSQYIGSFTTPEVNGTFNNWCGGCAPMSDANGDNKWEITIPLIPGTYEYKFAYDSWLGQENLVDGSTCTITTDGFTNRTITAIDAETLPAVCWESCELCPDFVNESSNTISVYPNPSNGNIRINSNLALPYNIEVFDLSGRKVQDMKVFQSNTEINLENLAKGAYQIRVSNNYNSVRETVIIK